MKECLYLKEKENFMNKTGFNVFLRDLKETCNENKVALFLHKEDHIIFKGDKFGGWFEPDKKELRCCFPKNHTNAHIETLIHESCHMDQWKAKTNIWKLYRSSDAGTIIEKLMKGKTIPEIGKYISIVQRMEAECDNMAIEKIKKYNLPIDIHTYIQKANSYLMLYTLLRTKKKWADVSPDAFKIIYSQMPSYKVIHNLPMTTEMKELYIEKCYIK